MARPPQAARLRPYNPVHVMLNAAFVVLGFAVLLGTVLAVLHLRAPTGAAVPWPVAAVHGLLGIVGLICLGLADRHAASIMGPPRSAPSAPC